MVSSRFLYLCAISLMLGVATVPFVHIEWSFLFLLVFITCILLLFYFSKTTLGLCFIVILFFGGIARFKMLYENGRSTSLHEYVGERVTIKGIVDKEPENSDTAQKLVVRSLSLTRESGIEYPALRILVKAPFYPEYKYGDQVTLQGTLLVPQNFESENGKKFNYRMYLAKEEIYYEMYKPVIELVRSGEGALIKEKLFLFKSAFLSRVALVLPEPQSALAGGLVLGVKQSLGKELEEKFRKTGIIHIVVLSGYNVTIIAEAFMKSLAFLPKSVGTTFGVVGIVLFAIITGGTATVVRSSIMALILVLGRSLKRDYDAMRAMAVAGSLMVIHNPYILLYDPSFQLSFLATLGLMLLSPHIEPWFMFVTDRFGMRSIFTSTFATQIFVLPYILYQIGEVSVIGLVVNILVLPLIPFTMLGVFLTGVAGFVWPLLSSLLSYFTYFFLAYELLVVELFAKLSFAAVSVSHFPLWLVVGMYVGYVIGLVWLNKRRNLCATDTL